MKHVLLVSIAFSPNVGGIETHFDDLTQALSERGWRVTVLTYKPITTKVEAKTYEVKDGIEIIRIPWFSGIFYRLVNSPLIEFLYLLPGLFVALPVILLIKNPTVIHSHGLVAGFVSVFWGKIFGKRVISTTHSIYNFPEKGIYRDFAKWIFNNSEKTLCLSKQSGKEIESLGIKRQKIVVFKYWIDLTKFKSIHKAKETLKWQEDFVVLFVGRLVEEKGIKILLKSVKDWNKNINLKIIGSGPLEKEIKEAEKALPNLNYLGRVDNENLPIYYSAADLLVVPSINEEGFGRVILESLACGTPVIGSNRGAIPEAMDNSVGELVNVSVKNIVYAVERLYKDRMKLNSYSENSRRFALKRYSVKNIDTIINSYV